MNRDLASSYLMDRLRGELDPERSRQLDAWLAEDAGLRQEADELAQMWAVLGSLEDQPVDDTARARFFAMLDSDGASAVRPAQREPAGWRQPFWQLAAVVAALAIGLWFGARSNGAADRAEVERLRGEVASMTRVVAMSMLQHQSASERLRAVSLAADTGRDASVVEALLEAVNTDPSVNVRLAAVEALAAMGDRTDVRRGLLQTLPRQASPAMQVAVADLLMGIDPPRSESAIRELLDSEELIPPVREHLREALEQSGEAM